MRRGIKLLDKETGVGGEREKKRNTRRGRREGGG